MNRADLIPFVSVCLDDTLAVRCFVDMPDDARLVVWQCGFEPMVVAVWSYLDVPVSADEAEDIALDYLTETDWFADEPSPADYVL